MKKMFLISLTAIMAVVVKANPVPIMGALVTEHYSTTNSFDGHGLFNAAHRNYFKWESQLPELKKAYIGALLEDNVILDKYFQKGIASPKEIIMYHLRSLFPNHTKDGVFSVQEAVKIINGFTAERKSLWGSGEWMTAVFYEDGSAGKQIPKDRTEELIIYFEGVPVFSGYCGNPIIHILKNDVVNDQQTVAPTTKIRPAITHSVDDTRSYSGPNINITLNANPVVTTTVTGTSTGVSEKPQREPRNGFLRGVGAFLGSTFRGFVDGYPSYGNYGYSVYQQPVYQQPQVVVRRPVPCITPIPVTRGTGSGSGPGANHSRPGLH